MTAFSGIHNFRDYGGYAVAGGGRLREGQLYRSAQHRDATPEDLDRIAALGLAAVIDLRGASERARAPCPRPVGFSARVYKVDAETAGLLGAFMQAARERPGGFDGNWLMRQGYAAMPYRDRLKPVLANYFAALAEADGPTLVHCLAGKDRTGLAVALLHGVLGVHRDDAVADYLLTNANADKRIATNIEGVRTQFGGDISDAQIREIMLCAPEYIEAALDSIDERSGGVRAYLVDELGVTGDQLDRIVARLVE